VLSRAAPAALFGGIAAAVVGLSKLHASQVGGYDYSGSSRFAWSIAYIVLLAVTAYGMGLPDVPKTRRSAVLSAVVAALLGALGMSVVQLVVGDALLPRFVVLGSALLLVPWYLLCVNLALDGRTSEERRDRVVLVAERAGAVASELEDELVRGAEAGAVVAAALEIHDAEATGVGTGPLERVVADERATVVVLDRAAQDHPGIVAQAAALHAGGVRVRTLSLFYEEWLGKLPVGELERVSMMFDIGELHRQRYSRVKRIVDVVLGAAGTVVLALVTPVVALSNLFGNRGPLLYRQTRVGKNGTEFQILKFRTMRPAVDGLADEWTGEDDPRITRFGHVLRRSHLDELPQVVNILRGELSVVGPRPEQPHYVEELTEKLPFYAMRHLVRPGLTGWAQVKYGYAGDERDALEKLQYEFFYLRRQSLSLDLRIVGRTIRSVLGGDGR
jgi:lipopolysaccharide/colanic/teichoic acid biosynthesis glycosyltransferase